MAPRPRPRVERRRPGHPPDGVEAAAKFELVLSENLEENESTWIVIYRPVSGYEFRLSSSENTREAFEFRQEITFGPGVPTRTRARAAIVQDKVRSVALAGPGFSAEQVLAGASCDRATASSFEHGWRIAIASCGSTGTEYHPARVVPMRTAAESKGKERPVDLQYRIARGRRTVLEVTGYGAATISSIAFGRRGPPTWCSTCWTTGSPRQPASISSMPGSSAPGSRSRSIDPTATPIAHASASTPACARAPASLRSEATRCSRLKRCRSSQRRVDSMPTRGRIRPR